MGNTVTISLELYDELISTKNKCESLEIVFENDYSFVGWGPEGWKMLSKDESIKHLRSEYEKDRDFYSGESHKLRGEIKVLKSLLNNKWYKRIFKNKL